MSASASSSDLQLLFDPHLIPSSAFNGLTDDLTIRPLARDDHSRGHVQLLTILTQAPDLSPSTYAERFDRLAACPDTYYTVVFVHKPTDRVITSGTVFVERKFIRNAGLVGHIEDIAVDKAFGGRGLGVRLIRCLEELARTVGCYKTILDCSRDNIGFYEKCG
jgi:glucosamine-phosphate N-acetyltransferase